jgi:hypothetical protein
MSISKQRAIEYYRKLLDQMMSDADFKRYFGDKPNLIMKYSELNNYTDIDDIIPEQKGFRIFLTEQRPNVGHWTVLLKYGDIWEWFDSYGVKPDGEFKYIPTVIRNALGQGGNRLSKLLKTKYPNSKIYYNKKKFQENNEGVNTCGRWVIARILAHQVGYELDDFITKVEEKCEETGKPPDILVCDWIQ